MSAKSSTYDPHKAWEHRLRTLGRNAMSRHRPDEWKSVTDIEQLSQRTAGEKYCQENFWTVAVFMGSASRLAQRRDVWCAAVVDTEAMKHSGKPFPIAFMLVRVFQPVDSNERKEVIVLRSKRHPNAFRMLLADADSKRFDPDSNGAGCDTLWDRMLALA